MKKTAQKKEEQPVRKRAYDIIGYPLTRYTRITPEILKNYGFVPLEQKDIVGRDIWELKVPFYHSVFRFTQGQYPATNPNCGVLMIHTPAGEASGFKQLKGGKVKEIIHKFPARTMNIAHYVNTAERLRSIILLLTEANA